MWVCGAFRGASQITVDLVPGTYFARVTRSARAPSSAGKHGGYDISAEGFLIPPTDPPPTVSPSCVRF